MTVMGGIPRDDEKAKALLLVLELNYLIQLLTDVAH